MGKSTVDSTKSKYWSDIAKKHFLKKNTLEIAEKKAKLNYKDTIINDKYGIMTFESFNINYIKEDRKQISKFLTSINQLEILIIDIQNNHGGATKYWAENIVGRLIKKPIINVTYPIIKDGQINRYFYSDFFENADRLKADLSFPKIPSEILDDSYYINKITDTIHPNNPIKFKGEIYLLVSDKVFSSSEGFAQFCKTTNWATVVGEQTGGDGIGGDPSIIRLPESGILISYSSLTGLNHNGSLNFEERTVPDIEIKGNDSNERLTNLIKFLNQKH